MIYYFILQISKEGTILILMPAIQFTQFAKYMYISL